MRRPADARRVVRGGAEGVCGFRQCHPRDVAHSGTESRYYCFGRVSDGMPAVRFTDRGNVIRIIGAGYWRRGKKPHQAHSKVPK